MGCLVGEVNWLVIGQIRSNASSAIVSLDELRQSLANKVFQN